MKYTLSFILLLSLAACNSSTSSGPSTTTVYHRYTFDVSAYDSAGNKFQDSLMTFSVISSDTTIEGYSHVRLVQFLADTLGFIDQPNGDLLMYKHPQQVAINDLLPRTIIEYALNSGAPNVPTQIYTINYLWPTGDRSISIDTVTYLGPTIANVGGQSFSGNQFSEKITDTTISYINGVPFAFGGVSDRSYTYSPALGFFTKIQFFGRTKSAGRVEYVMKQAL